ncbi:MAG: TetR/AcrR family transcriptional regulator [Pseudomonadota bacterium]
MSEKTQDILEAASRMFMRYGFTKTTMSDIADEAGVARQTVYNAFPGKDEILRGVVRTTGQATLTGVQSAWQDCTTLEQKIDIFHRLGPVAWFEIIRAAPDWGALLEGMHKSAAEEMAAMEQEWIAAISLILRPHLEQTPSAPVSLHALAEFFYSGSLNAKYGAEDVDHLQRRLRTVKYAICALAAPAHTN